MKNLVIYSSSEEWIVSFLSALDEFRLQLTSRLDFSGTADAVLISQDYAGSRMAEVVKQLRQFGTPCAVVTFDGTVENQEYLLGCGADDVLVLPMCKAILKKRLHALIETPAPADAELSFLAFDKITESSAGNGSFIVPEHDFLNIYQFVVRLLERLDQKAQLIIFRFSSDFGPMMESDSILHFLKVVQTSLRRGDISSVYGRQVLVILVGADAEGGRLVAERVIGAFNAYYNSDESCEVTCEMREINGKPTETAV